MGDLATRLDEISAALKTADYRPPEDFSALAVQLAKRTTLTAVEELRTHLQSGSTDAEVMAAVPFAAAFFVCVFVCCAESHPDSAAAVRMLQFAATIAHSLGDGFAERLFPNRDSPVNCH